jgi:dihydrofolate reductase
VTIATNAGNRLPLAEAAYARRVDVALVVVISLDGCITKHDVEGVAWASEADKVHFRNELALADAYVFGSGTYEASRTAIRAALRPDLRRVVMTRSPERYADDGVPRALEFTNASPQSIVDTLRADGCQRLAVLGGSAVYSAFLTADLCDEVIVTVEPRVFGTGTRLAGTQLALDATLRLERMEQIGDDTVVLRYRRRVFE